MLRDFIPGVGKKSARDRIDEVFSRDILGAVLVGSSFFKIIENVFKYYIVGGPDFALLIGAYTVCFILSVWLFAYWEKLEKAAAAYVESD